jgi:hypothetical protein
MAKSLLYVSRSLIAPTDREAIVADIVTVSHSRNASVGVTGALISTEAAFAQILEGPAAAVDELMLRIRRDSRHTDVAVVGSPTGRWPIAAPWPTCAAIFSRYSNIQADPMRSPGRGNWSRP